MIGYYVVAYNSAMENQANENSANKMTKQVDESEIAKRALLQKVYVGFIGSVKTMIDSGYGGCAISLDLPTDSMVSQIDPEGRNCLSALRDPSKPFFLGYVHLDVSYLGKTVKKLLFSVWNKLEVPMILGARWICKSRAILQSDDGTEIKVSLSEKRKKWYSKLFSKDDDNINYLATKVSVEVDGTGSVRARISTNRLHSVIRRDQLTDLQLSNLIPTSDATRKRSKVEGHVSLDVTYAGMTIREENVRVVSESDYPADKLILGMNWINKSRVVIQSKGSKITVLPPQIQNQK